MNAPSFDPVDLFLASVRAVPDRPALEVDGRAWTYAELDELSRRVAGWCEANCGGVGRVAVHGAKTVLAYAGILGVLRSGRAYVPLHPDHPAGRWQSILQRSGVRSVIAPAEAQADLRVAGAGHFLDLESLPTALATSTARHTDEAYVMFTSGSTGEPKGVPVGRVQLTAYLRHVCMAYSFTSTDRFSQFFALSFDLSVHDLFVCWSAGACLCVPPGDGALQSKAFIRDQGITVWFSVPSQAALLQRMKALQPGSMRLLRRAFFCGEALTADLARAWVQAAPEAEVVNLYGPTETTIAIAEQKVLPGHWEVPGGIIPLGKPFPDHIARVRDGNDLHEQGEGELVLSGPQVNAGYIGDAARSKAFFVAEGRKWYATGDRVLVDEAGVLHFLGRMDGQVKLAGHRVEPGEIDALLGPKLGGGRAVTVAVQRSGATELATFIDVEMDPVVLYAALREKLPAYMLPARILFVDQFPLGPHGKLDRKALIERATHG